MMAFGAVLGLALLLAILLWSMRILVKGQIEVSSKRFVRGTPARILGSIYLGVLAIPFIMPHGETATEIGVMYLGLAVLATLIAVIFTKDYRVGSRDAVLTHKHPNMTSDGTWPVAAARTYVKVQFVCLFTLVFAAIIFEYAYARRYGNTASGFDIRILTITLSFLEGFFITVIPALAFSAILPVLLSKRIRKQWPLWADYVLAETAMVLIVAIYCIFVGRSIGAPPTLPETWRLFSFIAALALPTAGLGVLSCQRVLTRTRAPP